MTITLKLTPELETEIRQLLKNHDKEKVRRLLATALAPTVESLLMPEPDVQEFDALADQLAEELAIYFPKGVPALSDHAVSRAGIYEEYA
jgi:hypothetical protein